MRVFAILAVSLLAGVLQAAPEVQGVFPHGGQIGTVTQCRFTGKNLGDVASLRFARPGLRGEIVERKETTLLVRMEILADAEPGRHDIRLMSPRGSTIAWFDVATLPEITEQEPNDSLEKAQTLTLPVLVNGIVKKGDYDFYRFTAHAGETLTFDLNGTRNGSSLDGVLALFEASGEQLAYNDDYYNFKDPHLDWRCQKDGTYFLRVNGSEESGGDAADYRLSIGAVPFVSHSLPAGAQRGTSTRVTLYGVNLVGVREVVLGAGLAIGKVSHATADQAVVDLPIPAKLAKGLYQLHAAGAMDSVPFAIGDLAEVKADQPSRRDAALAVKLPLVVNGAIAHNGESHYFRFHADRPGKVVLSAESMRLGYGLDPLVALYDSAGKRLAYQDEPNTNNGLQPSNLDPHLVVDVPVAGEYVARIRDFAFRGAPAFVYRLTLKWAEPDFEVRVHKPDETLYRGTENRLKIRVRRLEGWDTPVEIRAENLPPGVTATTVAAEPKDTTYLGGCAEKHFIEGTDVEIVLKVDAQAPAAQTEIRVVGRGTRDGKVVEREAWTHYEWRHKGWDDAETGRLEVTIADAAPVKK